MKVSKVLFIGLLLVLPLTGCSPHIGADKGTMAVHTPIYINGNSNFTYENGVVGGSGTSSDPYVIQSWEIDCSNAHGIWIANTTLHFVIRNVQIRSENLSSFYGIYLTNLTNARIENVTVQNTMTGFTVFGVTNAVLTTLSASSCSYGLNFFGVKQSELKNSDFRNNTNAACVLTQSENLQVENLQIRSTGMRLIGLNNSLLSGCNFETGEGYALSVEDCFNLNIQSNAFQNCSILLIGEESWAYNTHTITGNTVNGRGVLYVKNQTGQTISGAYGEIILASTTDSTISGITIDNGDVLIEIADCQRININSVSVSMAENGIYCIDSADIHLSDVYASEIDNGVVVANSASFSVTSSRFVNAGAGISLISTTAATISNSLFENSTYGVMSYQCANLVLNSLNFSTNTQAVSLMTSQGSQIKDSRFIRNDLGVKFVNSVTTTITRNLFMGTTHYAITMDASSNNNSVFENAFLLNRRGMLQCFDSGTNNRWYSGTRGNFWDDWTSPDANNDSIVDTPYPIDGTGGAHDNYPLVGSPLPQVLSVNWYISSQEIYTNEYASFTIYVSCLDIGIPNAYIEFSPKLGNITAPNYTDENGAVSGTYASGEVPGIENISVKITRAGFVSKTIWIPINILEYPSLQINLFPESVVLYGGDNTTVVAVVHSGVTPVEDAMLFFTVEPYATLSESVKTTDANGSAAVTVSFPLVENQTVFRVHLNATKSGYVDGYAWCDIAVNPLKGLEINVQCVEKVVANTSTNLSLTVKSENSTITGVNITLSSDTNCNFTPATGLTDLNGRFQSIIKIPPVDFETKVRIYVHAWKQGYSESYVEFEIAVGNPPQKPVNLTGEGLNGKVILRWGVATGAKVYYVYRSESQGGDYTLIANTSSEGYEDKDVVNGHTYFYKVCAENDFGVSEWSNEVGVTPHAPGKITPGFETIMWVACVLGAAGLICFRNKHRKGP
ncbi:MAG: right-handed parallel beta-helix repeat-containing protein [Thermoplasmata archaeon]|nr:right-handed parallel beta-helix repeat-containing protein [Thermoplasmata archaeon]